MAVAGAEKHQRAECTAVDQLAGFLQGRMEAVIVSDADECAGLLRGFADGAELGRVECAGFFDEDMLAGLNGRERDGRQGGVECRDDYGCDLRIAEGDGEVGNRLAAGDGSGEIRRAVGIEIASIKQRSVSPEGGHALAANEAAADDGEERGFEAGADHAGKWMVQGDAKRFDDASGVLDDAEESPLRLMGAVATTSGDGIPQLTLPCVAFASSDSDDAQPIIEAP